jgi:hypothetical protein
MTSKQSPLPIDNSRKALSAITYDSNALTILEEKLNLEVKNKIASVNNISRGSIVDKENSGSDSSNDNYKY